MLLKPILRNWMFSYKGHGRFSCSFTDNQFTKFLTIYVLFRSLQAILKCTKIVKANFMFLFCLKAENLTVIFVFQRKT